MIYCRHDEKKSAGNLPFFKPGYTHWAKTRYSFAYDVTPLLKRGRGEVNTLAAEVSAGWWRDKILTPGGHRGFMGAKSAFRARPDRRLGFVKARYRTPAGTVTSEWRYAGDRWVWRFSVPDGVKAVVTLPGESVARDYPCGAHEIVL